MISTQTARMPATPHATKMLGVKVRAAKVVISSNAENAHLTEVAIQLSCVLRTCVLGTLAAFPFM